MKCSVVSYSLSHDPSTLNEWKDKLVKEIEGLASGGSEIIMYPELFLMGLGRYFKTKSPQEEIEKVATFVHDELLPYLMHRIQDKDVLLVLGSGPRFHQGKIYNSAPVFVNGRWHFQDKLFLTPWETDFTPGFEMQVFLFKNIKTSVVICFDSEQPDLAVKLKEEQIELMLVPSATTNANGSNRVNRCSSARAVELGAFVLTSPLVGDSSCDLVDHNEGRQGLFLPAQEDVNVPQEVYSEYSVEAHIIGHYELNVPMMKKLKEPSIETKPFLRPFHPDLKIISVN